MRDGGQDRSGTWEEYKRQNSSIIVDLFHGMYKSTFICPQRVKVRLRGERGTLLLTFGCRCRLHLIHSATLSSSAGDPKPATYHSLCPLGLEQTLTGRGDQGPEGIQLWVPRKAVWAMVCRRTRVCMSAARRQFYLLIKWKFVFSFSSSWPSFILINLTKLAERWPSSNTNRYSCHIDRQTPTRNLVYVFGIQPPCPGRSTLRLG
jgi:hypothetical protein